MIYRVPINKSKKTKNITENEPKNPGSFIKLYLNIQILEKTIYT